MTVLSYSVGRATSLASLYERVRPSHSGKFVEDDIDVHFLPFLLHDLVVLVVVDVAQLHQLHHDLLLGIFELLVDLLSILDLLAVYYDGLLTVTRWLHPETCTGITSCLGSNGCGGLLGSTCTASLCTRTIEVILLHRSADRREIIKLALCLELGHDDAVLSEVIIAEVFQAEHYFTNFLILSVIVSRSRIGILKLFIVGWFSTSCTKGYILERRWLVAILLHILCCGWLLQNRGRLWLSGHILSLFWGRCHSLNSSESGRINS